MFPEYRELLGELKRSNRYVLRLCDRYQALDHRIQLIEARLEPGSPEEVEFLKRQKLGLTDELHGLLRQANLDRAPAAR
ncbi:MAG TPA: YdcH family protein [Azonexus sp.]